MGSSPTTAIGIGLGRSVRSGGRSRSRRTDPRALRWYGRVIGAVGRTDEALASVRRAVEIDPVSPWVLDSGAAEELRARQYDRTIGLGERILALDPNDARGYEHVATGNALLGRFDQCLSATKRGLELSKRAPEFVGLEAYCLASAGHMTEAERPWHELQAMARSGYVPAYFLAIVATSFGRFGEAVKWLEQGYAERDAFMVELKTSPWLDRVRADPHVRKILRDMNFPE